MTLANHAAPAPQSLNDNAFRQLAAVPPEVEWFANLRNPNTRKAYQADIRDFTTYTGIREPEDFRRITRAHVIAWRDHLVQRELGSATVRRKLAALSSLYAYLCDRNAVEGNPVAGVARPTSATATGEGSTPAISAAQARALLEAPDPNTLKGKRDRAILATLLYHGIRREELAKLRVKDVHEREGVPHLRIRGKRGKTRHLPAAPVALRLISAYLEAAGHAGDGGGALFRPVKNNRTGTLDKHLHPESIYQSVVRHYAKKAGIDASGVGVHSLRATAATNALLNGADIAKVQTWLGHANISTTRIYDRRNDRPEDSPTYRVSY